MKAKESKKLRKAASVDSHKKLLLFIIIDYSNNFQWGKALSSALKLEPFMVFGIGSEHISVGLGRLGGNISADLSLFVILYNTNFMNKLNDEKKI